MDMNINLNEKNLHKILKSEMIQLEELVWKKITEVKENKNIILNEWKLTVNKSKEYVTEFKYASCQ